MTVTNNKTNNCPVVLKINARGVADTGAGGNSRVRDCQLIPEIRKQSQPSFRAN